MFCAMTCGKEDLLAGGVKGRPGRLGLSTISRPDAILLSSGGGGGITFAEKVEHQPMTVDGLKKKRHERQSCPENIQTLPMAHDPFLRQS